MIQRFKVGDLGRGKIISVFKHQLLLSHEIIQAKKFLVVEQNRLLEEDEKYPAYPEPVRRRDDNIVDIALWMSDALGQIAGEKNAADKRKPA